MSAPTGATPGATTPDATAAQAQSRERAAPARHRLPLGRGREGTHFTLASSVERAVQVRPYVRRPEDPVYRPLRIYALDPAASRRDGAVAVVNVPYEPLEPGPRGALFEVVGDGPQLALDDHAVLLQQGRTPSPSDALFKRQMVYAVCSTTYAVFRHALGRDVAWGFDGPDPDQPSRLVIRPDADTQRNAEYVKGARELRFGVFEADATVSGRNVPRGPISTCLAHDVVVHETAHALLDGLRSRFFFPSNPDVLAFHEAFADVVAVLQRFTYREVVRAALRQSRGDLRGAALLTTVGVQMGQTIGLAGALRDAVGDPTRRYDNASAEPHERGAVLLAAVFDAFARVYDLKARRYVRLATDGTGVLPAGEIPDLLAELLSELASSLASQFLSICIRAIDYCPPVDLTFGEYLRAVITADHDLVPDDAWGYREAWIDAFRERAIYPADVTSLSEDALLWSTSDHPVPDEPDLGFDRLQFAGDPGRPAGTAELRRQAVALGTLVGDPRYRAAFGLIGADDPELRGDHVDLPVVESVRTSRRAGPDGQIAFDLVAEVTQRREVVAHTGAPGFQFWGGATVILGPTGTVRYVVRKSVGNAERIERQRRFVSEPRADFWGDGPDNRRYPEPRPLRMIHAGARPPARV